MFRIRRISDDLAPRNAAAIAEVQAILRQQFPKALASDADNLPDQLRDPFRKRFRTLFYVAERADDRVQGFALVHHAPDLDFVFLDYLAAGSKLTGSGIGGALYQRVRDTAVDLGAVGVFMECLPDDPDLCRNEALLPGNVARLRFYESFGARPIIGTAYETPIFAGADCPPYLVFDGLGRGAPLSRDDARAIVRAILELKYARVSPPGYIDAVVDSIGDDPVRLRPRRYHRAEPRLALNVDRRESIPLVVNDRHDIHHVRDRGYVEAPVRIASILKDLDRVTPFKRIPAVHFAERHIRAVHDRTLVDFIRRACAKVPSDRSIYPYVFPVRRPDRQPKDLPLRAGYFCIDTFTPLNANAWLAARRAVDCTLTAASHVLEGAPLAYALVRPPGHHAERRVFGGFCYLNNAAIAAHYLSRYGRVAVLDIDYHHGNGTQDIFWNRGDVLTVSIHGDPAIAYPYFSGYRDETGEGPGRGFNLNIPLPEKALPADLRKALEQALRRIRRHAPDFLVLAIGFDTAAGDPTGSWRNRPQDFRRLGEMIGAEGLAVLAVQEGGYRTRTLGANAAWFFQGLWTAIMHRKAQGPTAAEPAAKPARRGTAKTLGGQGATKRKRPA